MQRELRRVRRELTAQRVHLEAAQLEVQALYRQLVHSSTSIAATPSNADGGADTHGDGDGDGFDLTVNPEEEEPQLLQQQQQGDVVAAAAAAVDEVVAETKEMGEEEDAEKKREEEEEEVWFDCLQTPTNPIHLHHHHHHQPHGGAVQP